MTRFISIIAILLMGSIASANQQTEVQELLNQFVTSIDKNPNQYSIIVEESETINAFASMGKKIVVYTGLINQLDNGTALAMVVAHELGHIEERHMINGMARQGLFSIFRRLFNSKPKALQLFDGVSYMGGLHYSRGAEKEADVFAINLMNKLYCNESGKLEFFEKNAVDQKSTKIDEYFSTHPLSSTRLEYLNTLIIDAGCIV
jgi:beta-barrel assembly-enhancing protease